MTNHCNRSAEVLRGAKTGAWAPELMTHLAVCEICTDALIADGMKAQAEACPDLSALPHPNCIWFRAETTARRQALERAMSPLRIASLLAGAFGTLGTAALLAWSGLGFRFDARAGLPAEIGLGAVSIIALILILATYTSRTRISSE